MPDILYVWLCVGCNQEGLSHGGDSVEAHNRAKIDHGQISPGCMQEKLSILQKVAVDVMRLNEKAKSTEYE